LDKDFYIEEEDTFRGRRWRAKDSSVDAFRDLNEVAPQLGVVGLPVGACFPVDSVNDVPFTFKIKIAVSIKDLGSTNWYFCFKKRYLADGKMLF
jgi:hypothetical protein